MSRIGNLPIPLPDKVTVTIKDDVVFVKGPLGELNQQFRPEVEVIVEEKEVVVKRLDETKLHRSIHGLTRTLIANMVEGVSKGFEKTLILIGIGYSAELKGSGILLRVGYSHPVWMGAPPGVKFELLQPSQWSEMGIKRQGDNQIVAIKVSGINKALVGQVATRMRRIRPPEPYKGKGLRYNEEQVRRKAGKAAKK